MKLAIVTVAVLTNYIAAWDYYDQGQENHQIRLDTVVVPASHQYSRMNPVKWFFLGKNYRKEWSVPVKMPVFHLKTTHGGFEIEKLGGGEQTQSLHLEQENGREWVLRSVDKNVRGALPSKLRGTFIQKVVQDQISAAYPYAILTMHDLAKAVDIPTPPAELYYVPDDPALGKYRPLFAHAVMFLSPKDIDNKQLDTESTDSIRYLIDSSSHFQLMQEKILTVRLFDMLIADWDRHKGQWDWAFIDSGDVKYIFPVPEDRDQAFFLSKGALTQVARMLGLPHLIGFKEHPKKLKKLNNKMHDFDRYFLNRMDRKAWESSIRDFQTKMTDEVISAAIAKLPQEVYEISGEEIIRKLKARRNGLLNEGLRYYDFLAEKVPLRSTVDAERFVVQHSGNKTQLNVIRQKDKQLTYQRTFYTGETDVVQITNLRNDDEVEVHGNVAVRVTFIRADK